MCRSQFLVKMRLIRTCIRWDTNPPHPARGHPLPHRGRGTGRGGVGSRLKVFRYGRGVPNCWRFSPSPPTELGERISRKSSCLEPLNPATRLFVWSSAFRRPGPRKRRTPNREFMETVGERWRLGKHLSPALFLLVPRGAREKRVRLCDPNQ